jgi:hypothetical protein
MQKIAKLKKQHVRLPLTSACRNALKIFNKITGLFFIEVNIPSRIEIFGESHPER